LYRHNVEILGATAKGLRNLSPLCAQHLSVRRSKQ
jgi:hypothetical protein